MEGGISVVVGVVLVFSSLLVMEAEGQRKNRIRGNQGRRSVGKSGTTIQRKRRGAGTALQSTSKGFIRSTPGAGSAGRLRNSVESGMGEVNSFTDSPHSAKDDPSLILDDTTNPSLRDNGGVDRSPGSNRLTHDADDPVLHLRNRRKRR